MGKVYLFIFFGASNKNQGSEEVQNMMEMVTKREQAWSDTEAVKMGPST